MQLRCIHNRFKGEAQGALRAWSGMAGSQGKVFLSIRALCRGLREDEKLASFQAQGEACAKVLLQERAWLSLRGSVKLPLLTAPTLLLLLPQLSQD